MMYGCATWKVNVLGLYTTCREVLACVAENNVGILLSTIDLEDGSGDALITQARQINPALRCVLIADHHYWRREDAMHWRSPVILAAQDLADESKP